MDKWRATINLAIALLILCATAGLFYAAWANRFDPVLADLVVKNFAAIVGLPFAFLAAFVVVAMFRQGDAPVEFEAFDFKFKGAAGETILWVLCFSAIVGGIALLWKH